MLLAFASTSEIRRVVVIIVCIACALCLIAVLVYSAITARRKKNDGEQPMDETESENADTDVITDNTDVATDSIVMSRNVMYSAGVNGQFAVGTYTVSNADGSSEKFNMRVNGLVREYENGDIITFAEGDTVSPVSGSVSLNKFGD